MFLKFIELAFAVGFSTTYGYGEGNCGDIGKPRPCEKGAITAAGDIFDPNLPTAAVATPTKIRAYRVIVNMRVEDGPCVPIIVNDKSNPRWIGVRGFDLSPGALRALGVEPSPTWQGRVYPCEGESYEEFNSSPNTTVLPEPTGR